MTTPRERRVDVLVVGGGVGGVAAALAVARSGYSIMLTEETRWLGGQLTSQAVPPDEHPWIERTGCTRTYRRLRDTIRTHYGNHFPLTRKARGDPQLNPGAAYVSALAHEPRVALASIESLLAPFCASGKLEVLTGHGPVAAASGGDRVESVTLRDLADDREAIVSAAYVLDATETGQLLPLTGAEYVTGAESSHDTGEPHAPEAPDPLNMQAFSVCFALEHVASEDHTIDRPERYGFWRDYKAAFWPAPLLSWIAPDPRTQAPVERFLAPNPHPDPFFDGTAGPHERRGDLDLWLFRRIAARRNFAEGFMPSDITLVNWPMIDYWLGPLFEVDAGTVRAHLERARQLSLSFLYWMQTEAPRPDGGTGYPGLRLRPDVLGTRDGLAMAPYIRESRRIRAVHTIVEQELAAEVRGRHGAVGHEDSVGVGSYRLDLHPSTSGDGYIDVASCPFEIPLGALLPVRMRNLLPAAKNIGTTHITNGCHRLHPVEWNIGEVAGLVAAHCLENRTEPHALRARPDAFEEFARAIDARGVQRRWPAPWRRAGDQSAPDALD
ncbi:MAG: FAD-dependent oxidoreductase [Actinomycetota bacterium]